VQNVEINDGDDEYADFNMTASEEDALAGVCHARGPNADLPPVWMIYLPVGDLAESLRRVEAEEGRFVRAVEGGDGGSFFAAIQDPLGVDLALMQG
jgi:uncharacterized protein